MGYTFINISRHEEPSEKSYWKLWLVGIFAVLTVCFFHWAGYLLIAGDSVPEHVDAAVVLQGSISSENARTAAAMALLQRGSANRVAISVPRESYWGEEIPPIARAYLESIVLLTSNYQSRRVAMIWRKTLPKDAASVYVSGEGVPDPNYQPRGWWRQRLYAETWFRESAELAWASL